MIEKGYIYWIVFPTVFISVGACFYYDLHKSPDQEIFNSFKIITTGIAVITLTIAFVNIIRNKRLADITDEAAKNAEKLAKEAKEDVIKTQQTIKGAQSDFRLELLRNSLEQEEYRRCNDQLKEIKSVIIDFIDDNTSPSSLIHHILSRIERTTNNISLAINEKRSLSHYDLKEAIDLTSKIDTLVKKELKKLI